MQRRKGQAGEREVAGILSDYLGVRIERKLGQARDGGDDLQIGKFRIEVKRRRHIASEAWLKQAYASVADYETPLVIMRADSGEWMVLSYLVDFLPLLAGELK